jgi:hypothetical protein
MIVVQAGFVLVWLSYRSVVHDLVAGQAAAAQRIQVADRHVALASLAELIVFAAAGGSFLAWFHRAYRNLGTLGAEGMQRTPGWALGSWFIPFGSLVLPKRMADEVWKASDPDRPVDQGTTWRNGRVPALFNWWWGVWLIGGGVYAIGALMQRTAHKPNEWLHGNTFVIVGSIAHIAGAVLAGRVVALTTRRQEARAARLRSLEQGPAQPAVVWAGS